jgi:hypothetical protein
MSTCSDASPILAISCHSSYSSCSACHLEQARAAWTSDSGDMQAISSVLSALQQEAEGSWPAAAAADWAAGDADRASPQAEQLLRDASAAAAGAAAPADCSIGYPSDRVRLAACCAAPAAGCGGPWLMCWSCSVCIELCCCICPVKPRLIRQPCGMITCIT